jgi:hypothetical protein
MKNFEECEFRNLCGGSRSRSYALTRDYLAEDPRCVYQPNPGSRRKPAPPLPAPVLPPRGTGRWCNSTEDMEL